MSGDGSDDGGKRVVRSTFRWAVLLTITALLAACAGEVGRTAQVDVGGAGSDDLTISDGPDGGTDGADVGAGGSGDAAKGAGGTAGSAGGGDKRGRTATTRATATTSAGPYRGERGVTDSQVAIAVFYSQTGPIAALSQNVVAAVEAAFNEVNDSGGINGRKLVVKGYDDGSYNPSVVQASWERSKGSVFAGLVISGELLLPYADRDRIPLLHGTTQEAPSLASRYGFVYFPFLEYQARELMPDYLVTRLDAKNKRIAVIYSDRNAPAAAQRPFNAEAKRRGLNIVINQPVPDEPSSCINEVSNVQAKQPDVVFLLAYPFAAICVLRDARTVNFHPEWTSVAVTWNLGAVNVGSGGATEGAVLMGHMKTLETDCGDKFRAAVRKYFPDRANAIAQDELAYNYYLIGRRMVEHLRRTPRDLTRESFVTASEGSTIDDGCLSPATYGRGDRRGPRAVTLTKAQGEKWITIDPLWRTSFR